MKKLLMAVLGILFVSIGLFFCILYLNLFSFGYTFFDYVYFIIRRIECHILWIGIVLLFFVLHRKGE